VHAFFHSGSLLKSLNHTYITLIPKVPSPNEVSHFQPINLCNVIYKVISKLMVNKLIPLMDNLITPFQNAFIQGRSITNNFLIAHEIFDSLGKKKGRKNCFGALKIDMSKAYDKVGWKFLKAVLVQFVILFLSMVILPNPSPLPKVSDKGIPFLLISCSCLPIFCTCPS